MKRNALHFLIAIVASATSISHAAPPFVWIEAEKPGSVDFQWSAGGAKKSQLLSEGRCLYRESRENVPEDGESMSYRFDAPAQGTYGLWLRRRGNHARRGDQVRPTSASVDTPKCKRRHI